MTSPIIKVAVVQAAPVLFDTPATIERLVRLADEAAAGGAALVVFPEAYIGGYPKGLDFGARLGTRHKLEASWNLIRCALPTTVSMFRR